MAMWFHDRFGLVLTVYSYMILPFFICSLHLSYSKMLLIWQRQVSEVDCCGIFEGLVSAIWPYFLPPSPLDIWHNTPFTNSSNLRSSYSKSQSTWCAPQPGVSLWLVGLVLFALDAVFLGLFRIRFFGGLHGFWLVAWPGQVCCRHRLQVEATKCLSMNLIFQKL